MTGRQPAIADVWELCRRVGVSEHVIGRDWMTQDWAQCRWHANGAAVPSDDIQRVAIVRALFARPQTLILHNVGAGWTLDHHKRLVSLLRAYQDGSLEALTHRHVSVEHARNVGSRHARNTVLVCTSDHVLSHVLRDEDVVLTLESCRDATLCKFGDAFGPAAGEVCRAVSTEL